MSLVRFIVVGCTAPDVIGGSSASSALFPIRRMRVTAAGPSIDLRNVSPAVYKYDVLFNGATILDPELEVRGPGGR